LPFIELINRRFSVSDRIVFSAQLLGLRPMCEFCFLYLITLPNHTQSLWDCFVIAVIYQLASFADSFITPEQLNLPHPFWYSFARFALWSLYGFWAGLFATGLWVIAHECGHQAFSESKFINNSVGWVLHSACVYFLARHFGMSNICCLLSTDLVSLTTHGASPMPSIMLQQHI
jgi:hypothetical protein